MKRYGILDRVRHHADLKKLSYEQMQSLCASIRTFLIDHVSQTGGHLASNLGIVELAVALERVFDTSTDRVIYDVGHQAYIHKILTGRRELFPSLRKYQGLSGFMKPSESSTDPCITGHASNSVSVALGMAHARTLRQQKHHVVAVIGDGALTGGMAYEALNNLGASKEPLLVILNDNTMSINQNVGAMSNLLAHLRVSPNYLNVKSKIKSVFGAVPGGQLATNQLSHLKQQMKNVLLPNTLFEQMGLAYLGPVDGHDLKAVCELLERAKLMKRPVLLHVMTQKGRGYAPAEKSPDLYHGVSPFDPAVGISKGATKATFSSVFGQTVCALAKKDSRICAITAAMPSGTGLTAFAQQYPHRFFDVGIAEEHAVAMSAGMVKQGLKPICAIYSTFLQRAYDQIIHDVAIDQNHVVFAIDRAGIVGEDGETHNGVFDIAYLGSIPKLTILAPSNHAELQSMLSKSVYHTKGPVAIRYPRGSEGAYQQDTSVQDMVCIEQGTHAVLITYGILINEAISAARILSEQGISVSIYKLNCLTMPWGDILPSILSPSIPCFVIEDVVQNGSIGEKLCSIAQQQGLSNPFYLCNTGNRFLPAGTINQLYQLCHIDADGIAQTVKEALHLG